MQEYELHYCAGKCANNRRGQHKRSDELVQQNKNYLARVLETAEQHGVKTVSYACLQVCSASTNTIRVMRTGELEVILGDEVSLLNKETRPLPENPEVVGTPCLLQDYISSLK